MHARRTGRGHTLIELLVTLAVIATLLGLGVPAMRSLVAPAELQAWVTTYQQALHTTRHVAVTANRGVSVCELDVRGGCTGRWRNQLTLFFDDDRDGRLARAGDIIARTRVDTREGMQVAWSGFGERRFLHARGTGSWRQNGRFTFCPPAHAGQGPGRQLVVNVTGRTRVEPGGCGRPAQP